jgi:hypothetical protein
MATQIQLRRDTAANWTSTNPTMAQGEAGYETDTGKLKIGDGSTAWNSLAYQAAANIVDGTIVNADVNASAAIAGTKISPDFGSQTIATTGVFRHALGAAATPSVTFTGDLNTGIYSPGADQVAISTNGTGRLFIDASGRVGIGGSPSSDFEITSTLPSARLRDTTDDSYAEILNNNGALSLRADEGNVASLSHINFRVDGSERARIDSSGRLGLGTSSPAAALHVSAPDGTIYQQATRGTGTTWRTQTSGANGQSYELFDLTNSQRAFIYQGATSADPSWTFHTAGTARMYINNSGNVGIGTTSPDEALEVFGNIKLSQTSTQLIFEDSDSANLTINRFQSYDGALIADVDPSNNGSVVSTFRINIDGSERARIDSSGRLLVGTSTALAVASGFSNTVQQLVGNDPMAMLRYSADASPPTIWINKSRSATVGTQTVLQDTDGLGRFNFGGSDGTNFITAARIDAAVDGTPGANDMPGRLVFSTTADGAASPTERMRINNAGAVGVGGANFGSSGQVLTSNGSSSSPSWQTPTTGGVSLGLAIALA